MMHYLVAFGLLLHLLFWGSGVAMLVMPCPWKRFWPVLAMPAGCALQSAVVWFGAYAGMEGTNAYAYVSEVVPVTLLGIAVWRQGLRPAMSDVGRFGLVWIAVAGCLALLVLPVALASRGLTTLSLGSCDEADYAAGARTLMEFARTERSGFIGQIDVMQVQSVDNFFDYWLRLNHFTPAALIALNGSVLDCVPYELTSLLTAVLLAGALPVVFWSSRALFGYSGVMSLVVTVLFGISPVMWYAFAHVSPGQLLAAPAIALLNWSVTALWRGPLTWRRGWQLGGISGLSTWLILGSYNFIIIVSLVPAFVYVFGRAARRRQPVRFCRWLLVAAVPIVTTGVVFAPRVLGLAERFALLRTYDFGWRIPLLTAEGWLGMVQGPTLEPWSFWGVRWWLSAVAVGLFAWALLRAFQWRRGSFAWMTVAVVVPILAGYLLLQARGAHLDTNASYDAYKLFAVFYPLLLPAFCWWVTLRRSGRLHEWLLVWSVTGVVLAFNVVSCGMFMWKLSRPPLMVTRELPQLQQIESMADVDSVNMLIPDMWSRLWANAFLLRKEQYFQTHTYEGRLNTELRGTWDLEGGCLRVMLPDGARRQLTPRFALVDTRHPCFVRPAEGQGWYEQEGNSRTGERWQWTQGSATVRIINPHRYLLQVSCELEGWSPVPRLVALVGPEGEVSSGMSVTEVRGIVRFPGPKVPAGESTVELRTETPSYFAPGDPRPLGWRSFMSPFHRKC